MLFMKVSSNLLNITSLSRAGVVKIGVWELEIGGRSRGLGLSLS